MTLKQEINTEKGKEIKSLFSEKINKIDNHLSESEKVRIKERRYKLLIPEVREGT